MIDSVAGSAVRHPADAWTGPMLSNLDHTLYSWFGLTAVLFWAGPIPKELGNLTELRLLGLHRNELVGKRQLEINFILLRDVSVSREHLPSTCIHIIQQEYAPIIA